MRRPPSRSFSARASGQGGCETTDGCFVEPDGSCDHGQPSWLLARGLS